MSTLTNAPVRLRLALNHASRISNSSFTCRRCLHNQPRQPLPAPSSNSSNSRTWESFPSRRQTPFLTAFKTPDRLFLRSQSSSATAPSPLGALSQTIGQSPSKTAANATSSSSSSTSSWPNHTPRSVGYFLLLSATSVFGIVVLGGLTRLTESGLSITEWKPVTGSFPPTTPEHWEAEFALYRQSPEFKMLNSRMGLEESKEIYWMEWGHRLWGRFVGVSFLLPTLYFVARKRVDKRMAGRLLGICGLIGFQGFIGWWMVKSGLKDELLETGSQPRVSQYRLAAHLGTAFIAYLSMVYNGALILRENRFLQDPHAALSHLQTLRSTPLTPFRRSVAALAALAFLTAMSGALVAGLDAGLVYNDFPWMGHPNFLPPRRELLDPFYSHQQNRREGGIVREEDMGDLLWRNMFENPVTAQLDHRILATTTFFAVCGLFAYSRLSPRIRTVLPRDARKAVLGTVHLVSLQVALGISTLWYLVPTPLAAAHQAGALALLTGVFVLGSRVWVPGRTWRLVQRAVKEGSLKGRVQNSAAAAGRKVGMRSAASLQ
ncbi:cytochrome c oxidase assembly protein-like protein cox15 [Hortaea werneckii]|nr:cytochrome c oxidase assembly protein-like protein cox15 [Hortaea werneckii]